MLAFGVSSIGFVGNSYYQNVKDLAGYYQALDNAQLPVLRGFALDSDDIIRRYIIQQIMCQFKLDFSKISREFNIDFRSYFKTELEKLVPLNDMGLIELTIDGFKVSNRGRFLIRNVAVIFDKYLQQKQDLNRYSKVI